MNKIIIPVRITLKFIKSHPEWNFIYGNDYFGNGMLGGAWSCQKEPNTFHVPTLYKLCPAATHTFFEDTIFDVNKYLIDELILRIPRDKPLIPFPKIGEGYSGLKQRAPRTFAYLKEQINQIKYPNIEIDYSGKYYPLYETNIDVSDIKF